MIEVIRSVTPTLRHRYEFTLHAGYGQSKLKIVLNEYSLERRKSTRHRTWTPDVFYSARDKRDWLHVRIEIEKIEIPEDVAEEAKQIIIDRLVVTKTLR